MKTLPLLIIIVLASMVLSGCPEPDKPDLIVSLLESTGTASINSENNVEVPIRVTIRNQGTADADVFKTATEYTNPTGTYVVAFTVPGQSDIWYPHSSGPLTPGAEETFNGKVTFHSSLHGVTVILTATADSCSGDEFEKDHCRVDESDEGNNKSSSISLALP